MINVDEIVQEEIDSFNQNINSSSENISAKLHLCFKDVSALRNNLELVSDYINRKDYLSAYKIMLSTLESLLLINKSILETVENTKSI